jgi:tRNA threonylcarbamoyladenosine biosynthesis protein TsaB
MNEPIEPLILAIETTTRAGSVSLARGSNVLASSIGDASSSHSTDLLANIDQVLRDAGIELAAVDVFAAAVGPGSFTGLRIGLATAKSLAVALRRSCAGVSTLAAIAYQAGASERTVALLPAGRGELFAQMFTVIDDTVEGLDQPMHIEPKLMIEKYGDYQRVMWAGEGAHVQMEFLRAEAASRKLQFSANERSSTDTPAAAWIVASKCDKLAEAVARLAFQQSRAGGLIAPENLRANYVRPSDAEIKSKS